MAEIVGGFLMPHDPLILQAPDAAPAADRDAVLAAFEEIRERIAALGATTAIVVGADHYVLFGPGCLPSYLIGVGDLQGPLERLPGVPRGRVPGRPDLARRIRDHGVAEGFDWAVAKTLDLDHSIMLPRHFCLSDEAAVVPVYLASGVQPLLPKARAHALGRSIGAAVRAFPGPDRVVVIGSGGISHWVGMAEMGRVNPAFDRQVMQWVADGDAQSLIDMSDADIVAQGGNGALEVRNFLCAMGAMGEGVRGRVVGYVPSREWITGLGFIELYPEVGARAAA